MEANYSVWRESQGSTRHPEKWELRWLIAVCDYTRWELGENTLGSMAYHSCLVRRCSTASTNVVIILVLLGQNCCETEVLELDPPKNINT